MNVLSGPSPLLACWLLQTRSAPAQPPTSSGGFISEEGTLAPPTASKPLRSPWVLSVWPAVAELGQTCPRWRSQPRNQGETASSAGASDSSLWGHLSSPRGQDKGICLAARSPGSAVLRRVALPCCPLPGPLLPKPVAAFPQRPFLPQPRQLGNQGLVSKQPEGGGPQQQWGASRANCCLTSRRKVACPAPPLLLFLFSLLPLTPCASQS